MHHRFDISLAVMLLATPVMAAPPAWTIINKDKAISWTGKTGDGTPFQGTCQKFDASIIFDPSDLAHSTLKVDIDMATCLTGESEKDSVLPLEAWFNVAGFLHATYEATAFEAAGANKYIAHGTLTLKGSSQPLDLPFQLDVSGNKAEAASEVTLDRTRFAVGTGQWGGPEIAGIDVQVHININATKSGQ